MTDETKPEPTDAAGTADVVEKSPSQKLKEENDNLEREMERAQKIRNEALLAGTSGGHVEPEPEPKLTNIEYADKFMRGEANPLKEDDISIN